MEYSSGKLFSKKIPVPGILFAFLLILVAALLTFVITPIVHLLVGIIPVLAAWELFLDYTIPFGITLFVGMYSWNMLSFEHQPVSIWLFVILFPIIGAMSVLAEALVSLIPMPERFSELLARMVTFDFPGYMMIGVAAPILEELIFRGVILRGFLKNYSPRKAIIWSAIIFGVAHMNPWQFVAAFLISLVIGWIYWQTRSIWPGIFIHFINNSMSFLIGYATRDINTSFSELTGGRLNYALLLITSSLICFGGYFLIKKHLHKFRKQTYRNI